ncbi:sigma-70 family RNA polymerase sigma factor [Mucilaginibacter sabulilitoris]|uniref:Sigma-70 family RNA polymerase sigma factor n=1 Tax=Mucilaginibacter sabulilitoris TaxID=1173583 RepID=A0ABZ0U135_9SPHI|nr:sigma-70 family RNA polymerase sigma factor [Mucilaginibacter sabulilitoris]WPU97090.1 sigma-70 family RNA polymerase sigma factor [Mucilaginibacter sabulilitoris]
MIKSLPDEELLKRIQLDDQQAFSVIVYRYNLKLYRIVQNRVRMEDDAKDIIQEIFISLWNNRHNIQTTALYPYLSRSAFYAVIDWQLLHKKNLSRHHLLLENEEPAVFSIENQVIADELRQELLEEVEKMPDTTKAVFRMSRIDQKSVKEIATVLHLSEQTVKNNISVALKQLRRRMVSDKLSLLFYYILIKSLLLIIPMLTAANPFTKA